MAELQSAANKADVILNLIFMYIFVNGTKTPAFAATFLKDSRDCRETVAFGHDWNWVRVELRLELSFD